MEFQIENGILIKYLGDSHEVYVPEEVVEIGNGAFMEKYHIQTIILSPNIKKIGNWAFSRCKKLSKIEIPSGVTSIGKSAFRSCESLEHIVIPDTVEEIQGKVFEFCKALKSISLPSKIQKLAEKSFSFCISLTNISIPECVTEIGSWCFEGCQSLESIKLPECLEIVEESAFQECTYLTNISFGPRLQTIQYHAFYETEWLDSRANDFVIIHDILIRYQGDRHTVTIPKEVRIIGNGAFEDCRFLQSIILHDEILEVKEKAFDDCKQLKTVTCYKKIKNIHETAFRSCKNLNYLMIKDYLKDIEINNTEWNCHKRIHSANLKDFTLFIPTDQFRFRWTKLFSWNVKGIVINFEHYDNQFEAFQDIESKMSMAFGRLTTPISLSLITKQSYLNFINENLLEIVEQCIDTGNLTSLRILIELELISNEWIDTLITRASDKKQVEITSYFLNYKYEHIGYKVEEYVL